MKDLEREFIWKDREDNFIRVSQMDTKHVFYTWLMIWNHGVPPWHQIWFRHRYTFGSYYTKNYMLEAFRAMYIELKRRDDLGPRMKEVITQIEDKFRLTIYEDSLKNETIVRQEK
jgi:hypothetical protein